ncbi:MAG: polyphosphate:AMP phosphotransferase [Gemmatimonadales bacterium]
MFAAAEAGARVDKGTWERAVPRIRTGLLAVQRRVAGLPIAPVIIVGGAEGAGKGHTMARLLEWLDTRGVQTHVLWDPTDEERLRPPFWRYWRVLPPHGHLAILFGSWYTWPIVDRVFGRLKRAPFERALRRIRDFERMLSLEGVPVIKFWLHLPKKIEKRRLKELRADRLERWRLSPRAEEFFKRYDDFRAVASRALALTSTDVAPWTVVEATDARHRDLTVTTTVLHALEEAADASEALRTSPPLTRPRLARPTPANILRRLPQPRPMAEPEYDDRLATAQASLARLAHLLEEQDRALAVVCEGPDAGGKGGAIRRVTAALRPQQYRVNAVAAPTDDERSQPYLWRFWRHVPKLGTIAIFDRSWYGRVLVERVEGFATPAAWRRAYGEINEFEDQLTDAGIIVCKFWLHVSAAEQLRRFTDRQETPYKLYKLTPDDWRNRAKWGAYEAAACDMIARTGTESAPWVPIPANDKRRARVLVVEALVNRLADALGRKARKARKRR